MSDRNSIASELANQRVLGLMSPLSPQEMKQVWDYRVGQALAQAGPGVPEGETRPMPEHRYFDQPTFRAPPPGPFQQPTTENAIPGAVDNYYNSQAVEPDFYSAPQMDI